MAEETSGNLKPKISREELLRTLDRVKRGGGKQEPVSGIKATEEMRAVLGEERLQAEESKHLGESIDKPVEQKAPPGDTEH